MVYMFLIFSTINIITLLLNLPRYQNDTVLIAFFLTLFPPFTHFLHDSVSKRKKFFFSFEARNVGNGRVT